MASVESFGYAIIETTDLAAWRAFGENILGMQVAEQDSERLLLRMDEKAYRYDVRLGAGDGVRVLGLEVKDSAGLVEISKRLADAGYATTQSSPELVEERKVRGLASFEDPDGTVTVELYHGLLESNEPFVSKVGNSFIAGPLGIGHALQVVSDVEIYKRLYIDLLGYRLSDEIQTAPGKYATFLHCNGRHHSFAFAEASASRPTGIGHLMVEVTDLDMVGRALDLGNQGHARITGGLGKHTNDKMISMYVQSPSGFGIEYGVGGIIVDDSTWVPRHYDEAHYWGHEKTSSPA